METKIDAVEFTDVISSMRGKAEQLFNMDSLVMGSVLSGLVGDKSDVNGITSYYKLLIDANMILSEYYKLLASNIDMIEQIGNSYKQLDLDVASQLDLPTQIGIAPHFNPTENIFNNYNNLEQNNYNFDGYSNTHALTGIFDYRGVKE